jgi:hypothetical protein
MPRHCLPWVLAAALAAIGFQALQNHVVSVPVDRDRAVIEFISPAPLPVDRTSYSY